MVPRIRRVQIQNFKSIERAVVELAPLTVLVGPNGAGKSNFVEALIFLQQILSVGIEQALRWRSYSLLPQWVRLSSSQELSFGLRVELELGGSRADYAVEVRFDRGDRATVSRERCRVERASRPEAVFEVTEGHFVREIPGIRSQLEVDDQPAFADKVDLAVALERCPSLQRLALSLQSMLVLADGASPSPEPR